MVIFGAGKEKPLDFKFLEDSHSRSKLTLASSHRHSESNLGFIYDSKLAVGVSTNMNDCLFHCFSFAKYLPPALCGHLLHSAYFHGAAMGPLTYHVLPLVELLTTQTL